jgi:hypothetical protein
VPRQLARVVVHPPRRIQHRRAHAGHGVGAFYAAQRGEGEGGGGEGAVGGAGGRHELAREGEGEAGGGDERVGKKGGGDGRVLIHRDALRQRLQEAARTYRAQVRDHFLRYLGFRVLEF